MNIPFHLLAQLPPNGNVPPSDTSGSFLSPQNRDTVVILVGVVIVTIVSLLAMIILRKRQHKFPNSKPPDTGSGERPKYFRARGSRPEDEPTTRNPTLAERGGLPPIKEKPGQSS